MLRWILRIALVLVVVLGVAFWWLLLGSKAPKSADGEFDIAAYRALTANDAGVRPTSVNIEVVSTDLAPSFATEAGNFSGNKKMASTAFQIVYADRTIVIGGALDEQMAAEMSQSKTESTFDQDAYSRLTAAMVAAEQVWITHEHPDHVIAISRHPDPAALAPLLRLSADQISVLATYAVNGDLAPEIASIDPVTLTSPTLVAPGVVIDHTPGHSPGSMTMFVTLADGSEYLLIGDIVWMMSNIEALRSRPRLLEIVFHLGEDRKAVQRQVRALHDMRIAEPNIIIVPSHDGVYLDGLVAQGQLVDGFVIWE